MASFLCLTVIAMLCTISLDLEFAYTREVWGFAHRVTELLRDEERSYR